MDQWLTANFLYAAVFGRKVAFIALDLLQVNEKDNIISVTNKMLSGESDVKTEIARAVHSGNWCYNPNESWAENKAKLLPASNTLAPKDVANYLRVHATSENPIVAKVIANLEGEFNNKKIIEETIKNLLLSAISGQTLAFIALDLLQVDKKDRIITDWNRVLGMSDVPSKLTEGLPPEKWRYNLKASWADNKAQLLLSADY